MIDICPSVCGADNELNRKKRTPHKYPKLGLPRQKHIHPKLNKERDLWEMPVETTLTPAPKVNPHENLMKKVNLWERHRGVYMRDVETDMTYSEGTDVAKYYRITWPRKTVSHYHHLPQAFEHPVFGSNHPTLTVEVQPMVGGDPSQFILRVVQKGCKGLLEALYLKDDIGQVVGGDLCGDLMRGADTEGADTDGNSPCKPAKDDTGATKEDAYEVSIDIPPHKEWIVPVGSCGKEGGVWQGERLEMQQIYLMVEERHRQYAHEIL
jgi:hypothetical protein